MIKTTSDRLRGTLDALILKALSAAPLHGYGITRWLQNRSSRALRVEEGTLYPALYRLERMGRIEAEWGRSELGRRARFYRLTPEGERQLEVETRSFADFLAAVSPILLPASAVFSHERPVGNAG
jgi:PadR family transcriptional regulator PadR